MNISTERAREPIPPAPSTLALPHRLAGEIRRHAEREYPGECCGALLGRIGAGGRTVVDAFEIDNRRSGTVARRRFLIAGDDYRQIDERARRSGVEIVGFYHSHPDHGARPSEYDRAHAMPWLSYVIVSVARGESREMRSWVLADDRSRFAPQAIVTPAEASGSGPGRFKSKAVGLRPQNRAGARGSREDVEDG